jgi:type VI protein secretion system component VasF
MTSELEKLCNPVFQCLCNYWQLSRITTMVDREKFRQDITALLEEARRKALKDPRLEREFSWIQKPLVFFIDYMVKEGCFPFREEWWELSRNYNELSGDEKFFDLLAETMKNPDVESSFTLYYIMLGLGFDGVYRYKQDNIEQYMRLCMEKSVIENDIYSEPIAPPQKKKKPFFQRRKGLTVRIALIASAVFMVVCFIINLTVFSNTTKNYREILSKTAADSSPQTYVPAEGGNR